MKYYFGYGSNMSEQQMHERCPGARCIGMAALPGYRLDFTIYAPARDCAAADIVSASGNTVYGLVYEFTDEHFVAMDEYEGVPEHYERTEVEVLLDGEAIMVQTYEVVKKKFG